MTILDDFKAQQKLDKSNLYGSIVELPNQCLHAWQDLQNFKVPDSYKKIDKIVMTGMGGSGLGARIIKSVFADQLKYPLQQIHDYDLPAWADNHTLVICSSFSGFTEEPVQTAKQAEARNCKWMSIGTGGAIIDLAKKAKVPFYKINPIYNPSKEPRMAIGYSVIGQLVMASKAGIIDFEKKDLDELIPAMKQVIDQSKQELKLVDNQAKKMAKKFYQKEIVFAAARHLMGAGHTFKNQMNENAKNLSHRHDIPELNHHLMEGLRFPDVNKKDLVFFFMNSNLYPKRIQQRMKITQEVVKKNQVRTTTWKASSKDKLSQAFELMQFGGFVNYYLSMLYNINPAAIPWVDYFKNKLGQSLGQWK